MAVDKTQQPATTTSIFGAPTPAIAFDAFWGAPLGLAGVQVPLVLPTLQQLRKQVCLGPIPTQLVLFGAHGGIFGQNKPVTTT